jgi:ligand-binding sensor domain-containing protein
MFSLPFFKQCSRTAFLVGFFFLFLNSRAQLASIHFHHLTTAQGLSNSTIRSFAQDKYGFVWIGTLNGLNVFDGYSVKSFYKSSKPGGLPNLAVTALCSDAKGTMWIGTRTTLCYYDYLSQTFTPCNKDSVSISKIAIADSIHLWLVTNKGILKANTQTKTIEQFPLRQLTGKRVNDIFQNNNGTVYFACNDGLRVYNPKTNFYKEFFFPHLTDDTVVRTVVVDHNNNAWISVGTDNNRLIKLAADLKTIDVLQPITTDTSTRNQILQILLDKTDNLWMTTSSTGLVQFDPVSRLYHLFPPNIALPNSIASDNVHILFADKNGGIWAGLEGYGVDWFYPQKNHFTTIQPTASKDETLPGNWCRAVTQDSTGNLWLGTGAGLSCYNLTTKKFTNYQNKPGQKNILHANSIRSLLTDKKGFVWIGTSEGVNRYNPSTHQIEFFDESRGIPHIFTWTLLLDKDGVVWAGGNSGIYRWDEQQNRFDNFINDPLLGPYTNKVFATSFQDSKGRYWFGLTGALMYDPVKKEIKHYLPQGVNSLWDEHIVSITEDKDGLIWVGTLNGLSSFDVQKNKFINYRKEDGLASNEAAGLLVDDLGRIWIGTTNGLCCFDKRKNSFISFDSNDGLSSNQFNEQSAYRMSNGYFIYPTYKGFVIFKPEDLHTETTNVPVFISEFKILGKEYHASQNPEEFQHLKLRYDQNFFKVQLVSPYYQNVDHVWYAYKLEGFDQDWVYTQSPIINYTNVPGGDYVFHYKASIDPTNWIVPEKTLSLYVGTVYYKTVWFWILIAIFSLTGLFYIYRFRKMRKEQLYLLETKAQRLEKEKALVQYENLKQQLNPHFLFNSLTSLKSLIRINQKQAADFLDKMSITYRYILKSSEKELVTLQSELKFVQSYIDLQQMRFCEGLQVTIDVNESFLHKKIAPVTIQNLIENAIKHNRVAEDEPLTIDIYAQDNYLVVENNLQKKDFVETSNKQGLKNMASLYKYLADRPMKIESGSDFFTVKIPLL